MVYFLCLHVVVQLLSCVQLFETPLMAESQAFLSFTLSWSLLKLMPIGSVMPPIISFCHPLLLLLSIFPSIRIFSNELALHIRWTKYWSFSISSSNEYSGLISFRLYCLISLLSKGLSRVFSSTTVFKHTFHLYFWWWENILDYKSNRPQGGTFLILIKVKWIYKI